MKPLKSVITVFSVVLLLCLALCGCGKPQEVPEPPVTSVIVTPGQEDYDYLDSLPYLETVDFSGSTDYENIAAFCESHPEVAVTYTVTMPDGVSVKNDAKAVDFSGISEADVPEALRLMEYLPCVEEIDAGSSFSMSVLGNIAEAEPEGHITAMFKLLGSPVSTDDTGLTLRGISSEECAELLRVLPACAVDYIDLGTESENTLSWEEIRAIELAAPGADVDYSFILYDRELDFNTEELDLRKYPIDDGGALIARVVPCMQGLTYLDMDHTGVPDEAMAEIRDNNPGVNVVWRIFFGANYSVRTDVERILASNPGPGGDITPENCTGLKYCTRVKYLDLGHNHKLRDISFVSYMPDLEVCILAIGGIADISPLADCPKLEYLELEKTAVSDLTPIAGLENLRYLNLCYCQALRDISPIYGMKLTKLWLGYLTPIAPSQIEQFRISSPDTEVDATCGENGLSEGWRWINVDDNGYVHAVVEPRYAILRQQMGYDMQDAGYAYYWNDPLY